VALVTNGTARAPELPTCRPRWKAGYRGADFRSGSPVAPASHACRVIDKLNAETISGEDAGDAGRLAKAGIAPLAMTPADLPPASGGIAPTSRSPRPGIKPN